MPDDKPRYEDVMRLIHGITSGPVETERLPDGTMRHTFTVASPAPPPDHITLDPVEELMLRLGATLDQIMAQRRW